jgi:hypothetical protein
MRGLMFAAWNCRLALCATLVIFPLHYAMAQAPDTRTEIVSLTGNPLKSIKRDTIRGDQSVEYRITVGAGQRLRISMRTSNRSSYFNIKPAASEEAIHNGSVAGNVFDAPVANAGEYVIQVYLMRNAARRNETARFTLTIESPGAAQPKPDFADGLAGGPDYWQVQGLGKGARLSVRSEPRSGASRITRLDNGAVAKNLGCRMNGRERWCRIEVTTGGAQGSVQGWVQSRFLRESAAPGSNPRPNDALVPGTNYHATGKITCAFASAARTQCDFGVTRGQTGVATVFITGPQGQKRVLGFSAGKASSLQAAKSVTQSRQNDNTLVVIDSGAETYTIPDALINGG